jgi:aminopeptidase YwaD
MMKNVLTFVITGLMAVTALPAAAASHVVDQKTFDTIARELSGELAQELDRRIVEYHRIQASPMMTSVAKEVVIPAIIKAGINAQLEQFRSNGKLMYQTYLSPMGWSINEGELWLEGEAPARLCRYSDIPMCVSTYSRGGDWSGELVDVGAGTSEADYEGKDLKGKVALASGYAQNVVDLAVLKYGAVGAVIYPAANDRPDHPDMVRYNGLWTRAEDAERTSGSFQISANQYALLKARMAKGATRVRGHIDAKLADGALTLVHARIRGSETPDEEVIVTAHLDHPKWSANDNASGSAAMLEIVRTLQSLIAANKLPAPRKTIHFIWVPEYFGTVAYLTGHPEVKSCENADAKSGCVVANINMDMVGEDTVKTNGRFYVTRAPMSVPSFLDALLPDLIEQTREANLFAPAGTRNWWPADVIPYFQGSDHDMFLAIGVPSSMFGHDPDWTHHTSEDTPDKTDATEFRRVGVLAATAAYWIASADDAAWQRLAPAVAAEQLRATSARLVELRRLGDTALIARVQKQLAADAASLATSKLDSRGRLIAAATPKTTRGQSMAKRNTIGPVAANAWSSLTGDDKKWIDEQRKREDFDLRLFETLGFMNGERSNREIADLLTIEFGEKVGEEWVQRLASILTSQNLVVAESH